MTQRYSQNDEQEHILNFFVDRPRRFLDIGAYDGKAFSNTFALAERGWGGVCVEPSPGPFVGLMNHHAGRRDITLVNCALATQPGWITFHDSGGDAISTLDPAHRAKWEA